MQVISKNSVEEFISKQLATWPLAAENFANLKEVRRKEFNIGDLKGYVQCNPARVKSTTADVKKAVEMNNGNCFLCSVNRPKEQITLNVLDGWDVLVNPYPILPIHLTIVNQTHIPQSEIPKAIIQFAEIFPSLAVFYNGAGAGASAPAHMHLQAVERNELPLINLINDLEGYISFSPQWSDSLGLDIPFSFIYGKIADKQLDSKIFNFGGPNENGEFTNLKMVNAFFWKGNDGEVRYIIIPRINHRPTCYFQNPPERRLVSPGCIDMAGVIITPSEEDFRIINDGDILKIYSEVAFKNDSQH